MDRIEIILVAGGAAVILLAVILVFVLPKIGGERSGDWDNSRGGGRWGGYEG